MPSRGYVLNGVYHRVEKVPLAQLVKPRQSMFRQGDHARQRFDHSAEILQPHLPNGDPNPKFIEAYPDAAVGYGFMPSTEPGPPLASDTPLPGQPGFGGSIPWGYQTQPKQ